MQFSIAAISYEFNKVCRNVFSETKTRKMKIRFNNSAKTLKIKVKQTVPGSRCSFPVAWHGEYFHLGYSRPLMVSNNSITEKGECVWSSGSQYVLEGEEEGGEKCWRCLSIYRKHNNVLQYKESKLISGSRGRTVTHARTRISSFGSCSLVSKESKHSTARH